MIMSPAETDVMLPPSRVTRPSLTTVPAESNTGTPLSDICPTGARRTPLWSMSVALIINIPPADNGIAGGVRASGGAEIATNVGLGGASDVPPLGTSLIANAAEVVGQ